MKRLLGLFLLLLMGGACKSTDQSGQIASARVRYVGNEARNTITVNSMDYGDNNEEAIYNAKRLTFQNLFFRGVAGSPFNDPLIGINEQEEYKKHKDYLTDFYQNRMESFILNSTERAEKIKGGQRKANVTLTVNLRALRQDLEDKQVIKKFGL